MPRKVLPLVNPFLSQEIEVGVKKRSTLLNGIDEDVSGNLTSEELIRTYDWDMQKFTKLYHSLKKVDDVLKLGRPALLLYTLVPHLLTGGQDWVELKSSYLEKKLNLSAFSVASAIRELTTIGVIAKRKRSEYWICPKVFFSGDRLKLYKKNNGSIKKIHTTQLSLNLFDYSKSTTAFE